MDNIYLKIIAIALIFLGEAIAITAELFSAKIYNNSVKVLVVGFAVVFLGSALLVAGYVFGFKSFKNIWIVSVLSLVSILLVEPLLDYVIFKQLPTRGAFVGLILGVLGFVSAIFIK